MIDVLAWSMFEIPQEISLTDTVDVSPRSMYVKCTHTHISYLYILDKMYKNYIDHIFNFRVFFTPQD